MTNHCLNPPAALKQIPNKRLWQACNLNYLSHQLVFAYNNLRYEGVIWNKTNDRKDLSWNQYCKIFSLLSYHKKEKPQITATLLRNTLHALCIIMNTARRRSEIYLPCGIRANAPQTIETEMDKIFIDLEHKVKENNKNIFENLVTMEYICPAREFSSTITKILWNICRISISHPFAFIPWTKKDAYYHKIVEYGHNIFLDENKKT